MSAPVIFSWDGESMRPIRGFQKLCDQQFVVGETYKLEECSDRSPESHRHYMASITEYWSNLPEIIGSRFLTPDKFRKWCLIQVGYCKVKTYPAKSQAEALRFAAYAKEDDDECEVVVDGKLVEVKTAESQSYSAMTRKRFQESKQAVLDFCAKLIVPSQPSPPLAPTAEREKVAA